MGAARAAGQTARLGSLSPGKLADLIVLDRDVFQFLQRTSPAQKSG